MRKRDTGTAGWQWFDKTTLDTPVADDTARLFTQCFSTPAGTRVLDHLNQTILSRSLPPTSSATELFYHEGQRATVALINTLVSRGKINPTPNQGQ